MRYNEAAEAYGTEEGKLEGGLPGGVIEGLEFTEGRAAGVVDQDIDLSTICAVCAASCTSTGMAITRPLLLARSSSAVFPRVSGLRAPMTISAPSAASAAAQAFPSPLLAARMSAVFPDS